MGLQDVIEETKKQLEEVVPEKEEVVAEKEDVAPAKEEEVAEKDEVVTKKEEPKAAVEFKERRQARELREKLEQERAAREALEARIAEMEKGSAVVPNKDDDIEAYLEHKTKVLEEKLNEVEVLAKSQAEEAKRHKMLESAEREFISYEEKTRQKYKDYDDVRNFYIQQTMGAIKLINPEISNEALAEAVKGMFLTRAGKLIRDGYENPVAVMYEEAKKMGYKEPEQEKKPDLSKVAANRARNAGTVGASGGGDRGDLTPQTAATMKVKDWAKLSKAEKDAIFSQLGGL